MGTPFSDSPRLNLSNKSFPGGSRLTFPTDPGLLQIYRNQLPERASKYREYAVYCIHSLSCRKRNKLYP